MAKDTKEIQFPMRVEDLIEAVLNRDYNIRELESDLQKLRGADWEEGIAKDTRTSITIMYTELLRLRLDLTRLKNTLVGNQSTEWPAF